MNVIHIARFPDWIATEYANQFSPRTFFTYGPPVLLRLLRTLPQLPLKMMGIILA